MCTHISSYFEFQFNNWKTKQGSLSILELVWEVMSWNQQQQISVKEVKRMYQRKVSILPVYLISFSVFQIQNFRELQHECVCFPQEVPRQ